MIAVGILSKLTLLDPTLISTCHGDGVGEGGEDEILEGAVEFAACLSTCLLPNGTNPEAGKAADRVLAANVMPSRCMIAMASVGQYL